MGAMIGATVACGLKRKWHSSISDFSIQRLCPLFGSAFDVHPTPRQEGDTISYVSDGVMSLSSSGSRNLGTLSDAEEE